MNERRDIADIISTADAQRQQAPPPAVWERVANSLGHDPQLDTTPQVAPPPRPTRTQLRAAQLETRQLRRRPKGWWLAAAAAIALLLAIGIGTYALDGRDSDDASQVVNTNSVGEDDMLELSVAQQQVWQAKDYGEVIIKEGSASDKLMVCVRC